MFASYDPTLYADPEFDVNTGWDFTAVSPSSGDDAISVNNAVIRGSINTGGGTVDYDSGKTNSNQLDQNLWLSMSEDDSSSGLNLDGIQNSFNGEINEPEYPDVSTYEKPDGQTDVTADDFWNANSPSYGVSQNFWQNGSDADSTDLISADGSDRTIGMTDTQSVLTTPSITLQNGATLTIKGDVVLIVKRNFNIHGDIEFEDGASLHLIAAENNHFTGSTNNRYPIDFRVTPYVDLDSDSPSGPNVQFNNTDRVAMVIDAPYSKVSTGGQGNVQADYMGAVVAENFECPNGVRFYYDITLGEGDGGVSEDGDDDSTGETEYNFVDWSEMPPKQMEAFFESEFGIDV